MQIGAFESATERRLVRVDGELRQLAYSGDLRELLASGIDPTQLEVNGRVCADLTAPIRPGKIVAIGLNYRDHIRETGMATPSAPLVFAKFPSSVIGPTDSIRLPALAERVDWEVELGVIIGRRMRRVDAAATRSYIFGYTVANDVSARDIQFRDGQWVRGKSFDTFCPIGPVVVTADEIEDPQALILRTRVNGELVQDSTTAEMIFSVAEILAFCSASFTLEAGDLVLTGTPWGCGEFMEPKRSLSPGDLLESEIEGIGTLTNLVIGAGEDDFSGSDR
jgi:2-keto-4-pentenoate hydratase/2-oxohepta-3-ene-1,7-dioic acid hydratase in catechol pathway